MSMMKFKDNLTLHESWTILMSPILGKASITNTPYTHDWTKGLGLMEILGSNSKFK